MKIGPRTYTEQETVIINAYKKHIQKLQNDIDEHWKMLADSLHISTEDATPESVYLWDYVMNDF